METATRQPPPPAGRYSTAAEAILVALREFEEDRGPGALMPGGELIKQVTALLEDRLRQKMLLPDKLYPAPGAGAATPCANWGQLSALQALECVEKKARKRECPETGHVFMLTAKGRRAAQLASDRSTGLPPARSDTLYPAPVQSGLILLVDNREGAGEQNHLVRHSRRVCNGHV